MLVMFAFARHVPLLARHLLVKPISTSLSQLHIIVEGHLESEERDRGRLSQAVTLAASWSCPVDPASRVVLGRRQEHLTHYLPSTHFHFTIG